MKPDVWMDGSFVSWDDACIHPLSFSMQRGATLFESIDCMQAINGKPAIFRLDDHLRRFQRSSEIVGIPLGYSISELHHAINDTVARSEMTQCTIRPLAFYADPGFSIYPGDSRVSVVIGLGAKKPLKESIRIMISNLRKIESSTMPVKAKVSGNYIAPMIAVSEAIKKGFDDTVLLDRDGYIAEGATSNIFIVEGDEIITSPGDNILQGITRTTILTLAEHFGITLKEAFFPPERLQHADEVFISSSGLGVMPVSQVDDVVIGNGTPGPVSIKLRDYYSRVATGAESSFDHWLTYIDHNVSE